MKMRIPKYNGRPMKLVKKYKHFALFIDEKTGIRQCYQYWDLTHYYVNNELIELDFYGNEVPVTTKRVIPKQKVNNDLRLGEIMERIKDYEEIIKIKTNNKM